MRPTRVGGCQPTLKRLWNNSVTAIPSITEMRITVTSLLIARQSMTIPASTTPVKILVIVSLDPIPDLRDFFPSEIIDSVVSAKSGVRS